jgi:hypothetical protein
MGSTVDALRARLERGDSIDIRGLGKAGGGLVLAIQAFAEALTADPRLDVQDWPLFSSARKKVHGIGLAAQCVRGAP